MTVAELIKKLKEAPQDAIVFYEGEQGPYIIDLIEVTTVLRKKEWPDDLEYDTAFNRSIGYSIPTIAVRVS
jgi:hypothetical protein